MANVSTFFDRPIELNPDASILQQCACVQFGTAEGHLRVNVRSTSDAIPSSRFDHFIVERVIGPLPTASAPSISFQAESHDGAIAVSVGGSLCAVLERERLTGVKSATFFPATERLVSRTAGRRSIVHAVQAISHFCNVSDFKYAIYVMTITATYRSRQRNVETTDLPHSVLQDLGDGISVTDAWVLVDHHAAHAAAGFFDSGLQSALALSFDGGGSDGSFVMFHAEGNILSPLNERLGISRWYNFGYIYRLIGKFLDECGNEEEPGTIMAYTPTATPQTAHAPHASAAPYTNQKHPSAHAQDNWHTPTQAIEKNRNPARRSQTDEPKHTGKQVWWPRKSASRVDGSDQSVFGRHKSK
jgi:predicted NodU family carbamoyl transferase